MTSMPQVLVNASTPTAESLSAVRSQYDKTLIARHFSRAASHYNQFNQLQRDVGQCLLHHAPAAAAQILDVGCGPAALTKALLSQVQAAHYVGVDLAPDMVAEAQRQYPELAWLQADVEALPFAAGQFDLVIANLVIQWCNRPDRALRELWRMVKPGGQLLVSTVLADSLAPLQQVWEALGSEPRQNQFETAATFAQAWQRAIAPGAASQFQALPFSYEYDQLRDILAHLKGIGASYTARTQTASPLTRHKLAQAEAYYRAHYGRQHAENRIVLPLHWNIGIGVAVK